MAQVLPNRPRNFIPKFDVRHHPSHYPASNCCGCSSTNGSSNASQSRFPAMAANPQCQYGSQIQQRNFYTQGSCSKANVNNQNFCNLKYGSASTNSVHSYKCNHQYHPQQINSYPCVNSYQYHPWNYPTQHFNYPTPNMNPQKGESKTSSSSGIQQIHPCACPMSQRESQAKNPECQESSKKNSEERRATKPLDENKRSRGIRNHKKSKYKSNGSKSNNYTYKTTETYTDATSTPNNTSPSYKTGTTAATTTQTYQTYGTSYNDDTSPEESSEPSSSEAFSEPNSSSSGTPSFNFASTGSVPRKQSSNRRLSKAKDSKSHEGLGFCFNPDSAMATEFTITIDPEEPDPLEYALDNGILPIICGYMPPSAAPCIPQFPQKDTKSSSSSASSAAAGSHSLYGTGSTVSSSYPYQASSFTHHYSPTSNFYSYQHTNSQSSNSQKSDATK